MPFKNHIFKLSTSKGCQTEGANNIGVFSSLVKMPEDII